MEDKIKRVIEIVEARYKVHDMESDKATDEKVKNFMWGASVAYRNISALLTEIMEGRTDLLEMMERNNERG